MSVEQQPLVPSGPGPARGSAGRLPAEEWAELLDDAATVERYRARVCERAPDKCWYWLGAISDTGHGKLRAGRGGRRAVVVSAHVFGFQLAHGVLRPRNGEEIVIRHKCDEASCQNPACWIAGTRADNVADYLSRRHRGHDHPLADIRGAAGRAVAIREAILDARRSGRDVESAIWSARAAGVRDAQQDTLF